MTLYDLVHLTSYIPTHDRERRCKVLNIRPRKNYQRFSFLIQGGEIWSSKKGHISTILYPKLKKDYLDQNNKITPMNAEVLVYCTCPAFLYWGSKYWSTQDDYNIKIYVEHRPPYIRDPHKERYICKHVMRASRYLKKKSFRSLNEDFDKKSATLASLQYDIKPVVSNYLEHKGYPTDEIQDILLNINNDNFNDILENLGVYGNQNLEIGEIGEISLVDSIIQEDLQF
jgi:hypothetical protein